MNQLRNQGVARIRPRIRWQPRIGIWQWGWGITTMELFHRECTDTSIIEKLSKDTGRFLEGMSWQKAQHMVYKHIMARLRKNILRCYNHHLMMTFDWSHALKNPCCDTKRQLKEGRWFGWWWSQVLTLYVLIFSEWTWTCLYILCHSSTLIWHRHLKSFLK